MKQFKIISVAAAVLLVGVLIAYRNTSYLGYNNTRVVSINSDSVDIMDYHIEYNDIKDKTEKINKIVPKSFVAI